MGEIVLVLGESGSGKSSSLFGFAPHELGVLNVASKRLPFRNNFTVINNATYGVIKKMLENPQRKAYAIDDSQYLLAFDFFNKAKERGYDKFTDMAVDFYNLLKFTRDNTPPDCIIYFLHHTENTPDNRTKVKTIGKMLDEKLTVEGLFTVVLLAKNDGGNYVFETQNKGASPAKTPRGMFQDFSIPNDLKHVDTVLRDYWGLAPIPPLTPPPVVEPIEQAHGSEMEEEQKIGVI